MYLCDRTYPFVGVGGLLNCPYSSLSDFLFFYVGKFFFFVQEFTSPNFISRDNFDENSL